MNERVGPTFGESIRRRGGTGHALLETRHSGGLRLPTHAHGRPTVTLLLEGSFSERMDGRTHECRPLDVVYKPGGIAHANEYSNAGARCFVVEVEGETAAALEEEGTNGAERPWVGRGAVSAQALRLYRSGLAAAGLGSLEVEELIVMLLWEGTRRASWSETGDAPGWIARVMGLLHADPYDPPRLTALAAEAGVHPSHVCRAFRRQYGCTISSYLQRRRVDEAVRRLAADPSVDLSALALALGFYDQSHFTRVFRRITGTAPGRFRDSAADPAV